MDNIDIAGKNEINSINKVIFELELEIVSLIEIKDKLKENLSIVSKFLDKYYTKREIYLKTREALLKDK